MVLKPSMKMEANKNPTGPVASFIILCNDSNNKIYIDIYDRTIINDISMRALKDRRMDMREASECARNRNEWRTIVTQF